jgi:NADH-quinone oxidoreductase subunit E
MAVRRLHPDQPASFAFTPDNLAWAKAKIGDYPPGKEASAVIPILWRVQEQLGGYVTEPSLRAVADMLSMAYIRVYEVATFYTMFQLSPVGTAAHVQVCGTTPCMLRGARDLVAKCKDRIAHEPHELSADKRFSWEEVECLGSCANAPLVQIGSDTYEDLTPELLDAVLDSFAMGKPPAPGSQIGRRVSCPEGGQTTLTDASLYNGSVRGAWQQRFAGDPLLARAAPATSAPAAASAFPMNVAAAAAMANSGLVPELEARASAGRPMSKGEMDSLRLATIPGPVPGSALAAAAAAAAGATASNDNSTSAPMLLSKPRGGMGDDLKLIWGVAEKLEARMNDMGIWHFDQIAAWTPNHIEWFEAAMPGFKGRIERDKWLEQCAKLAAGWRPDGQIGERPKG